MAKNWWEESTLESAAPKNESADEWWSGAKLENAPQRTWGEAIKDTGAQLAEGVNTTLGAIPSAIAPQSKAAGFFRDNAEHWRDQQSDVLKGRIAETDKRIQEAGKDGVMSQIGTAASEYWNDPAQAARLVATNLPSMAATLGTGAAAGFAAKGVAAARGLDAANKAALAAKYGTTTAAATNAALNAGGARGEAFEDLQKTALAQGMSPEQAEQAGVSGSILPGVVGGVAGAISGKIGLEKALLGQATTGAFMRKAGGAFGAELAGEQIEELAPKVATNYQVGQLDAARGLTDDVGRTMVETAIGSGPGAVVAGGAAGMRSGDQPPVDPATAPGAADPSAPVPPGAAPVEAPDLQATAPATEEAPSPIQPEAVEPAPLTPEQRMAELDERMGFIDQQAKANGWDKRLIDARDETRAELDALRGPAPTDPPLFDAPEIDPIRQMVKQAADAGGALSTAAGVALDLGATNAQFLGDTGRDVQLSQTGPGVTDESNIIDVDAREVPDQRGIPTARRLTNEQGGARATASQTLALPAPTNLREGLERIRAQRQEAARLAQVPPTQGANLVPQAPEAQQAISQQPQAGGQAIAGPAAAPTAGPSAAPGGSGVQAAGVGDKEIDAKTDAVMAAVDRLGNPGGITWELTRRLIAEKGLGVADNTIASLESAAKKKAKNQKLIEDLYAKRDTNPGAQGTPAPGAQGTASAQKAAGREGYDTPVELDAARLKAIIEQTRGAPLVDKPAKLEAWRNGTAQTDAAKFPIELSFTPDGRLDVNDGRHRIALAAERGEKVTAFIDGKDAQRAQVLASQYGNAQTQAQQAQAGPAQPAQGLTDAAPAQNTGAQSSTAAGAQTATAAEPEFTTIKTVYGDSVTVRTADLNSDKPRLRQYTKNGKSKAVPAIHRDNLDLTGDKRAAIAKEDADNPFFNVITTKDGSTFANQAAASRELNRLAMGETHEVVSASEVQDGAQGFVIQRKLDAPAQETTHNGTRIYPTKTKVGDEVKSMWAVESPGNQRRRAAGERTIGGDSLHDTIEQAKAAAEREAKRDAEQQAAKAGQDAADKARLDAEEARKAANRPKSVVERRKDAILDGPSKIGQGTKRAVITSAVDNGYAIEAKMVYDYAAKKRDQETVDRASRAGYILGVSNGNLPLVKAGNEAKARLKEGKYEKPEYRVYQGSDTKAPFREITKTEYDYAQELKAQRAAAQQAEAAPAAATQQVADDFLPEGWSKSVNGYTKRPVYRMEQGGGQPFAVVTQVEGVQYEVQIRHGDKQLIVSNQTGALSEVLAKAETELTRMTQADSVTHQDPGEKAEAATPGVVTDSLKKAARNEDTKPSEMRKWLVGKIDEAIAVAPEAAVDFLSFDVPGDGAFKVQNSQARLQEFRKKVLASPGFKDGGQKPNTQPPEQTDSALNGSGSTVEAIRNFLADGDVQGAVEYARLKGVEFTPVAPQLKLSPKGKAKHMPASVKSSVPSVAEGLTQVEAEQINQYLTAEQARAEPADAKDAAAQQAPTATATVAQQQAAVSEPLPPTDIRMGDKVMVDGEMYTVTGPLKEGRKSVGVVADRDADTDPLMGVRRVFLRGDDAIRAKIAANSQSNEQAAAAQQAPAATETVANDSAGQDEKAIRYELPPEKSTQQSAGDEWMAAQSPSFKPTARQQLLMDAVAKALDDGAFYNSDVNEHVAKALGVTPEQRARNSHNVDGGDFGYDVYGARKAVEAQRSNAKSREFANALNLNPGDALGTLIFNDGKVTTGVKVIGLNDSGLIVTFTGKRGSATLNGEVGIDRLAAAIDRAKERGKRSDGYAEFVESKVAPIDAAQQAPAATETVAQPITRADVTAAQQQAATLIGERIDAMTAGEVNTIARRFLPTMGVKPTVSKERNKAAVTDFTKVNPMAAADEFGVTLPADVRRALDAEMQGKVAEAGPADAPNQAAPAAQPAIPAGYKPAGEPFYRDGKQIQGYAPFAPGERVTMKESAGQSGVVENLTSPDDAGVFSGAMVKFDNGSTQIVKFDKLDAAEVRGRRFNIPAPPTLDYRLKQRGGSTYLIPPVGRAFTPETRRALRDWARDAGFSASIITDNEISVASVTDGPSLDYIVDGVKEQAYGRQADKERAAIQSATGARRDPTKVSMFNPYNDGDIVTIGGQDWTVKQDTPGWHLTTTGNWRGQHPTIRNVKAMADLIRAVEQAAVSQPAKAQPEAPKLTPAEAKSLMAWEDLGQKDGVKTHALTFYESQADKDAKRGRMIVAKVSKGDRSATAWMVDGEDKTFGMLAQAKKLAEEVGMARAVADGFVEQGDAPMFSRAQAKEIRNLVTLHNLTDENLRYADSMGGIPVPSIGITKVESPFGGFGNITLIAPKGMIDPKAGVPVYDRDAWTARFPTMNFKKVKAKMADAFYERMKPVRELMAGDDDGFISQLWEQLRNASVQSPEKITGIFTRYEAGRVMYAKEVLGKTIKVPMRNVRPATPVGHDAQLLAYWKKHGAALVLAEREMSGAEFSNTPENKAFEEEVQAAIRRYADAAGAPEMAKGFIEQMMPDGTMGAGTRDRLIRDFKTYGTKEVDRIKLGEAVNKAVKRDDPAYLRWVESLVKPLFDEPTITLRGREVAPTLDNIVDAMTVGATAGAEKSMTFSAGKVAAMLGKQFKSLDEIKAARDQVVSAKAETEGKKATDALLDVYRTHVSQFYGGKDWRGNIDTWAANDDSMEALAKAGKLPPSDASIRATLARMNFKGVDQRAVDMAREAIAALRNAATDYFEAKPQRAVTLDEFKGAVVPKGTSAETLAILEKHGIAVEVHNKTEGAREKAIQKLAKRLDRQSGDMLFARDSAAPPSDSNARNVATQMLVDGLKAKWTRAPEIIVARNMQDPQIPQRVRDYDAQLKSQGSDGEARGFIYKGKVYLLSDQLKGPQQIAEVLFHEVLGHYGLRGVFGKGLDSILQQMGTMRRRDVVAKAREYGLFNKDALGGLDKSAASDSQIWAAMSAKDRLSAAEEVLAEMAQTQPNIGFVQRAIAAIRNWLRANVPGFERMRLTDADIVQAYILPARGYVTRSNETAQQAIDRAMLAFSRDTNEPMTNKNVVGNQGGRSADDTAPGEFAMAGDMVDGLLVRDEIPNQGSIGSSIDDYTVLRGIREIPLTAFTQLPKLKYYSISEEARTKRLAEQIKASGEINPLIVVIDKEGPYVLEGGHRFDALREIGKTSFPALVVLDNESLNEPTAPDSGGAAFSRTTDKTQADAVNTDIRFRSADMGSRATAAANAAGAAIKSVTVANIKQKAGFKLTDYLGLGLQALGRRQIVDIYGDTLPLAEYTKLVTQMEADKNEGGAEADQLVTRWAKLPDEAKLADLMHDATLAQIDPDKPYVDGDDKAAHMMLQGRFKALSADAKAVYRATRDSYQAHHAKVRSAIKERIERSEIKGERKAALLKQMDDEFFKAIKGVYFPLARFGQYAVTVKGPDGKVESVSRAETKAEAEALRNSLLSAFPRDKGFTVGRVMLSKDFIADRDAVGRGFMTELYQVLDKQDMDAAQRAELEDTLGQLYLSSLPDLSWAKHGIHRKGTPGFSQDARRAYAQNMFHGSRYLAKLRYSDLMQDELTAMQKHVDDWREVEDFDQNSAQRVVDEMNKRHESLMNPKSNPLSTALTSLGFVFHLGLSPASAMVNLSQTALVAYPIMGAKWGFNKAGAALLKASKEAAAGKNDITGSLNADERAAYDEAVRAGTIDVTMAHDLAGIAQGEDAGVMWKIRPVMRWASFLFHHAERFNRQVTFVAAYRLARETGADHKAAFEQATKATYDGHFDYGAANRPRVMQGNAAKVLLLFKQYGQNMVYTLSRNAYQSIKGTDAEKAEARKALAGLLTSHAMAAGVLGLPMVSTLLAAASMIGGDDDEPWDAKVALQNMLADAFGQKPAEVLAHGLSRLTPWDISGRVGLDRLIFPDVQEGLEGQRLAESAMAAALGPVAGIGVNVLKGAQHMSEGRYAMGLEAMLPSALRGPVKALRYAEDGVQDKSGISILDQVSPAAVAGQALGFSPSAARNAQEGKSAILAHDRALGERRQELLTKIARATMAKDEEAKADAREEIRRFNEKNPGRRINPNHIMASVRGRQKRIDQAQDGVYLPRNRREAMEAGRFATSE